MARNELNVRKLTGEEVYETLSIYVAAKYEKAHTAIEHKDAMDILKEERDKIMKKRDELLRSGMVLDNAIRETSTLEVDNKIRKESDAFKGANSRLAKDIKAGLELVPENIYEAYARAYYDDKHGDFQECILEFLENLGISEVKAGAPVRKVARTMVTRVSGSKRNNARTILEKSAFTRAMKKKEFNELFLDVFCDTYFNELHDSYKEVEAPATPATPEAPATPATPEAPATPDYEALAKQFGVSVDAMKALAGILAK